MTVVEATALVQAGATRIDLTEDEFAELRDELVRGYDCVSYSPSPELAATMDDGRRAEFLGVPVYVKWHSSIEKITEALRRITEGLK